MIAKSRKPNSCLLPRHISQYHPSRNYFDIPPRGPCHNILVWPLRLLRTAHVHPAPRHRHLRRLPRLPRRHRPTHQAVRPTHRAPQRTQRMGRSRPRRRRPRARRNAAEPDRRSDRPSALRSAGARARCAAQRRCDVWPAAAAAAVGVGCPCCHA